MKVLDYGYVKYVEHYGSDERIIEAARQSTQGSFRGWPEDEKLLRFLWEHGHTTPFEMAGVVIDVKAPIFVFRQWHRHRTWSYNEASARYAPLPEEDYLPGIRRLMANADGTNKQAGRAKGADVLTMKTARQWQTDLARVQQAARVTYENGLELGVPKELARGALTVFAYSQMRASANLLNVLRFLGKRLPNDAQEETRLYAEAVRETIRPHFPRTLALFEEKTI